MGFAIVADCRVTGLSVTGVSVTRAAIRVIGVIGVRVDADDRCWSLTGGFGVVC